MSEQEPGRGPRRLQRSHDSMIAGVAGGIADYFDADPTIVRLLFVLLFLLSAGFVAFIAYIAMWIIMPPPEGEPSEATATRGGSGCLLAVLALFGAFALFGTFGMLSWRVMGGPGAMGGPGFFWFSWPVVLLVVGGIVVLLLARGRSR